MARPELMVRFWLDWLMLMPGAPSVSVLPAVIVTGPAGLLITKPLQPALAPRATELAVVTVLSHTAMAPVFGTMPPTQLFGKFRLIVLSALLIIGTALIVNVNELLA